MLRCKKCEREFEFPIYKPGYILRGKVVVDQIFVYPITVIDGEVWQLGKSGVLEPACPYCECPVYEREGAVELMWPADVRRLAKNVKPESEERQVPDSGVVAECPVCHVKGRIGTRTISDGANFIQGFSGIYCRSCKKWFYACSIDIKGKRVVLKDLSPNSVLGAGPDKFIMHQFPTSEKEVE